ncbi:hypothetical protein R1sor_008433 [Riccia sorocarpa]|uniref:Reverse transcriptase domain-containing protein n=1 Tax=Riccia sorocarpa TaxID=122646 RepID=A0ABD3HWX0_9MARC
MLPWGRAPGIDGFGYDALRELWWLIGEDYSSTMQSCWISGSFPTSMLEGVIKLIPKELRPVTLHHWRPIALLTAHYKLLDKVIAVRFALILPKIVPPQQQGFIKGEGCPRGLTHGAVAKVQVNNSLTPDFLIERGVRQGCPLAPLLFALASVPFILIIQSAANAGAIQTVQLPGDLTLDVTALADDTAIFLALHEPTFQEFFQLLGRFQSSSGAKVNLIKSKIMLLGRYSPPSPLSGCTKSLFRLWVSLRPVGILEFLWLTRLGHRMLGLMLYLQSLVAYIHYMTVIFHLRGGGAVLLRFLVQSKLSFALSLVLIRNSQQKTIRQLLRSLLWGLTNERTHKIPLVAWDQLGVFATTVYGDTPP